MAKRRGMNEEVLALIKDKAAVEKLRNSITKLEEVVL